MGAVYPKLKRRAGALPDRESPASTATAILNEAYMRLGSLPNDPNTAERRLSALNAKSGFSETGESEQLAERMMDLAMVVGVTEDFEWLAGDREW